MLLVPWMVQYSGPVDDGIISGPMVADVATKIRAGYYTLIIWAHLLPSVELIVPLDNKIVSIFSS